MRPIFNKAIISSIFAFLFFNSIETSWLVFLIIFITVWLLVYINFSLHNNQSLYISLLTISVTVLFNYCINVYITKGNITQSVFDELCFLIVMSLNLAIGYMLVMSLFNNQKKKNANPLLIKKREKDLTRLMSYLDNFNIIGLNGRWGTGKTFIINELKNRVKNQYEFIDIDLMTCNLNEMQPTLIRAFEEVMLKNRILPKYSNKMKNNIATSSIISKIQDLTNLIFTSSDSNSEVLQEFQKELGKLDKKILVIYEDLDRISNKDIIREIFSISERISNENIKIIYQYDESIMVQLKFSPDYLEKYIPFKINITELNFWEILQFELKDIDESILTLEDFKFIIFQEHRFNKLHEFFEHKTEYTLVINYIPIRKVKQMVKEILLILRMNKDIYTDHKETVISFFVLKHLYPDGYEKLDIQESLLETLKFKIDDNYYTILQLIESYKESRITKEKIKDVFSNEQNIENYELLKLFNYEIINSDKFDNQFRLNELETRAKHYNEKIDRVVWNLLYEGKSVFTDNENAVNKFKEMVLTKPLSKQKEAFHDFWGYLFNSDGLVTDNTTIFKIGHSNLLSLFESFKIANMDSIMQIKLIEFYFECNNIKDFNLDVVKCMNLSLLKSTDEYVLILNYLNSLQIVGNLNGKESFTIFLNKYIHALTRLGYIHSYKYFYEINDFVYDQDFMLERFNEILEDLVELSDRHKLAGLTATVIDLNTIFQFVEKIIEILNCDEKLVIENRPFVKTKITSKKQNQEEFDRLKHLFETRDDKNKVIEKIEASYKQKKITLYEIDVLLQEVEQKNTTKF